MLLSSHILAEVEKLGDRVRTIRDGRTVKPGTLSQLRHLTRTSITAEPAGPPNGLSGLRVNGNRVTFEVEADGLDKALRSLPRVSARSPAGHLTLEEPFLWHYQSEPAR